MELDALALLSSWINTGSNLLLALVTIASIYYTFHNK